MSLLQDNPAYADLARQAGFALDVVEGYAAALSALLAIPVAGFTAGRIAALAHAQTTPARPAAGRAAHPHPLLTTEAGNTAAGATLLTAAAALALWAGTTVTGVPLGLGAALAGAANTLPVTALSLSAALPALGWMPRAVVAIGMLPAAGGFLLTVLADSIDAPAWLSALSPSTTSPPSPLPHRTCQPRSRCSPSQPDSPPSARWATTAATSAATDQASPKETTASTVQSPQPAVGDTPELELPPRPKRSKRSRRSISSSNSSSSTGPGSPRPDRDAAGVQAANQRRKQAATEPMLDWTRTALALPEPHLPQLGTSVSVG